VFRRRMVSFPFALVCLLQKLLSHDTWNPANFRLQSIEWNGGCSR
jgi:hypothetical protein